jgi:hypothetical protein
VAAGIGHVKQQQQQQPSSGSSNRCRPGGGSGEASTSGVIFTTTTSQHQLQQQRLRPVPWLRQPATTMAAEESIPHPAADYSNSQPLMTTSYV